jgi:hypothetical protein
MFRIATLLGVLGVIATAKAAEPMKLQELRREYQSLKHPNEPDRVRYITRLVRFRESFTRADADMMFAIDKEIIRHPMPAPADPQLAKKIVGKWTSPRHQYLYRADGTWTMLPEFIDGQKSTHGIWRVDGNQFSQGMSEADAERETIILLTSTDFVWSTRVAPYYMRRGDVFPWRE